MAPKSFNPIQTTLRQVKRHNGMLALALSLALVVAGSLQLVHDQLIGHHHTGDCAMYMVDAKSTTPEMLATCQRIKQTIDDHPYSAFALVVHYFHSYVTRAPPTSL